MEKNGIFQTVQCKATMTENGAIDLRSCGGTKGKVYDSVLNHSNLDLLFCVDKNYDMWLIPVDEITAKKQILLRKNPTTNNQGFQTYKYQVQFLD